MHRITCHLRGLLVALATLALSAGVVLAARPASVEAPAAAAGEGLTRTSEAAGKIVPVRPEAPAVPGADEDEDVDEDVPDGDDEEEDADPSTSEGERPQNHGWFVSQAATGATPASADNHGAYVSEIARGDDGKPESATAASERGAAAADAAKGRKADKGGNR